MGKLPKSSCPPPVYIAFMSAEHKIFTFGTEKKVFWYYDDIIILDLHPRNQFLEHFQTAKCLNSTYFQAVVLADNKNSSHWIVCARQQSACSLPKPSLPFEHIQGGGRPGNSLCITQHAR